MPIIDPFDSVEQASGGIVDPFEQQPKQSKQPKRKVGAVEAFARGVGDSLVAIPDTINAVVGQAARPVDAVLGTNIRATLTDPSGPVGRARQAYKINPQTEELDGAPAALAQGVGALPRDLALAYTTGGAAPFSTVSSKITPEAATSIAAAVKSLMPEFRRGAVAMSAPGAIQSRDAYNEATAAGATPVDAATLGTIRGLGLMAQGALPIAKEGNLLTRAASGVPLAVAPNAVQRQLENTVAPASMQRSPSIEDDGAAGVLGALMAAALGPRAGRIQTAGDVATDRARWNTEKFGTSEGPSIEEPTNYAPPAADPMPLDPKAQVQRVAESLFRTGDDAPAAPSDLSLVPKAGEKDGNYTFETRSNPDPDSIPSRLTLEGDAPNRVLGDGEIRDIGKTFGMSDAEILALPREAQIALRDHADGYQGARQAFGLADRRQSQADMDMANRGELGPDYQSSGAAAHGGRFDGGMRTVLADGTLVDRVLDADGQPVMNDQGLVKIKVPLPDGEVSTMFVKPDAVYEIPANQRLAQDFVSRSSEPPKGVGEQTMRDEKMPRRSTDRIAGDEFGGKTEFVNPTDKQVSVEGEVFRGDDNQLPNREQPQARGGDTFDMEQPTTAMSTVRGEGVRTPFDTQPANARNQLPDNRLGAERGLPSPDSPAAGGRETGKVVDKPPRQPEEPIMGRETGDPFSDDVPNPRQPEATAERTEQPQQPRQQSGFAGQLLADIRGRGGIAASEALDITGDHAASAGRRMPGVFRANGMTADALLELLQQRQWLGPDATIADARAVVRDAFDGRDVSPFDGGVEAAAVRAEEAAWQEHLWRMENDPEYRAQEERAANEFLDDVGLERTEENSDWQRTAAEAYERLPDDVRERILTQFEGDDAGYYDALRKALDNENTPRENQPGREDAGAQEARTVSEEGEPGFRLEQESEAERRVREQREADDERARKQRLDDLEAKAKADTERDSFDLTGSDRPADANKNQGDMFGNSDGGFTLSMNPFANPTQIKKAFDFLFGSSKARAEHWQGLSNDLADIRNKVPHPAGNVLERIARYMLDSSSGAIRSISRKYKSDTFDWVIDQFSTEAGSPRTTGQTFEDAVELRMNKAMTRLTAALEAFGNDRKAMEQVVNRVRTQSFDNSAAGKAAKEIADMLKETLKYMRDAGVEVGEVKGGYYPREFDMGKVLSDHKGFIPAVAAEYKAMGMTQAEAEHAAQSLYERIVYGDHSSMFNGNGGAVQTPFVKERVFSANADKPNSPLAKFFVADPAENLTVYLQRATRRAEIARRFGDKFSRWNNEWVDANGKKQPSILSKLEAEGAQQAVESLKEYVAMSAGLQKGGSSPGVIRTMSVLRTWGSLAFLEKATLSSLSEFITPAIRASGASKAGALAAPVDMARSLNATIADLIGMSKTAKQRREFAEDLGLIAGAVSDMVSASRFSGGEAVSKAESKILSTFFRRTGLTQWTDATRVASVEIGRIYLRRLVKQVAEGDRVSIKFLKELGVPESQIKQFASDIAKINDGRPAAGDLQGTNGELYRNALQRFLKQSIMVPSKTAKPKWMNSPMGSVVGQLQSFNYAFYENVWKRNAKLAGEAITGKGQDGESWTMIERYRLAAPLLTMPALVGAAFVIGEGRDALLGDPNKRREEKGSDKFIKAASRGAPLAPIDPLINYMSAARYHRGAVDFAAGPVLGTVGRGLDAGMGLALHNSDKTNTAERKAARAVYDIMIEPSANLALSVFPAAPATAFLTQVAGSGDVREKFVSTVAGKDSRAGKARKKP